VDFAVRIGVNTGEVVTGDPGSQTLVTGDPVNVAARLEQAAKPGEILLGAPTHRLVRDAVAAAIQLGQLGQALRRGRVRRAHA
jgi:class 3 adenylate cyclase